MSWSYSKLSKYERCPFAKKCRYDDKVVVQVTESPQAIRGSGMHKDLEVNLGKSIFDVPEWIRPHHPHLERYEDGHKELMLKLNDEWMLMGDNTDEDYYVIAIIDLSHIDEGKWVTNIDYKSGKRYDKPHADQLELYNLITLAAYPEVERVEGKAYYLDESPGGWSKPIFTSREQFDDVKRRWLERVAMMDADTECAPRPGWYCKWCDYRGSNAGPCRFG